MKKLAIFAAFLLVCLVQLLVPSWMLVDQTVAAEYGAPYRFRLEPVDPYDAFRGRYVVLNLSANRFMAPADMPVEEGTEVYAVLEEDDAGFARIARLQEELPAEEVYLRAEVLYVMQAEGAQKEVLLDLPIKRFYMEESMAPEAEAVLRELLLEETPPEIFVTVKILNNTVFIEDLFVGDESINNYLEGRRSNS